MKLHTSRPSGINTFTGYGEGFVLVNGDRLERSVIVLPDRLIEGWAGSYETLSVAELTALAELGSEVLLLGTGSLLRFPAPQLMREVQPVLARAGLGLEVMDVKAACRTYNILIAEGRKVAAALLLP